MNTPPINIQIDETALREQISTTINEQLRDMAIRLRLAADRLDNNEWLDNFHETVAAEFRRGVEYGRALAEEKP